MSRNKQAQTSPRNLPSQIGEVYVFGNLLSDTGNLFDITSEVNNITTAVENLANAGAKNIIVPNLPDLNQFPGTSDIAGTDNLDEMIDIFNSNLYEVINSDATPDEYAFFGGTVPGVPAQPSAATHRLIAEIAVSALASEGIDATEQFGTVNSDRISGNNDSDNILGLAGDDKIRGRRGADILSGGAGDDTLKGNRGEDYLLGGSGNDVLVGGKNDDILNGGSGHNYLKGGFGRDIFVVNFNGNATIQDFNPNRDRIDLAGSLAFSDLDILQKGSDTIIYFDRTEIARLSEFEADFLSIDNFIETF